VAIENQERISILRVKQVMGRTGHTRSTLYLRIQQGTLPKPVSIGPRAVGWPSDEIEAINVARIAGKTDEEIIALVAKLEVARKTGK
jgi:prophage regulatory protein